MTLIGLFTFLFVPLADNFIQSALITNEAESNVQCLALDLNH